MESRQRRLYREQLAPDYLTAAWEAFRDAGDPRVIYRHLGGENTQMDALGLETVAHRSQVASLRNAVIYSAMACEAAANDFLAETTGAATELFEALDRLPTVKKLLAGPQAVLDAPLFSAGSEPLQTVTALFKRRNDLVHPRPRDVDFTGEDSFAAALLAECDTQTAAGYIVAVAEVTVRLAGSIGQSGWAPYAGAQVIHDNGAKVRELGAHFRRTLPQPTDPRPPSLDELAERARARKRR